jgi:hypothetical protein
MTNTTTASADMAPHLDRTSGLARLVVDGRHFPVLGVELHNSTPSGTAALSHGLEIARKVNATTVLASVTWEALEPTEGNYDFSSVDKLVSQVRKAGFRLVLLWFGAWKNGSSSYAPAWVKLDWQRFPRCVLEDGRLSDTLTPFGPTELDAPAFQALVEHVEQIDAEHRTVIMIQIENEIGLLGASRDHSEQAGRAFQAAVPESLRQSLLRRPGFEGERRSWADITDDPLGRDEAFMAWGYASHVEALARRARTVSPLPFYVNAWLDSEIDIEVEGFAVAGGQVPGTYPSGGPLPRVADVWTSIATSVDLFTPDVYFGDPDKILPAFAEMSRGLFIPEQRRDQSGVGTAFLAIGEYGALGVSPFGVDSAEGEDLAPLEDAYALLSAVFPVTSHPDGTRRELMGFHLTDAVPTVTRSLGSTNLVITRATGVGVDPAGSDSYGMVVNLGDDTLLTVGRGFRIDFEHADQAWQVGLEAVEELQPDGMLARMLNGDETAGGSAIIHPPLQPAESPFPIPMSHAHSGISRCRLYRLPTTLARRAP